MPGSPVVVVGSPRLETEPSAAAKDFPPPGQSNQPTCIEQAALYILASGGREMLRPLSQAWASMAGMAGMAGIGSSPSCKEAHVKYRAALGEKCIARTRVSSKWDPVRHAGPLSSCFSSDTAQVLHPVARDAIMSNAAKASSKPSLLSFVSVQRHAMPCQATIGCFGISCPGGFCWQPGRYGVRCVWASRRGDLTLGFRQSASQSRHAKIEVKKKEKKENRRVGRGGEIGE